MQRSRKPQEDVVIKAWTKDGKPTRLMFAAGKHAAWAEAYWRAVEAFNPHLPDADEYDEAAIGPIVIELIRLTMFDPDKVFKVRDVLKKVVSGDLSQ
jgi:hypothetical protein